MNDIHTNGIKPSYEAVLWGSVYALIILLPLLLLVFGKTPSGTAFWWDFSVALGLSSLALLHMMSVLTARISFFSGPFGIDVIYYFHRQISLLIVCLVLAHPLILFIYEPLLVYELTWPVSITIITGIAAVLLIAIQVTLSLGREWLNLEYDIWRRIHAVIGALSLLAALSHMVSIEYYSGVQSQYLLWIIYAVVWMLSLIYVHIIKPIEQLRRPYQVENVQRESKNSWSLRLKPVNHSGLDFKPGQFAWLSANSSPFAFAEHPFSFSSSATKNEIGFVIKELGDFSSSIKYLKPGQRVYLDGPYGVFSPDRYPAPGYMFIAGGIGIAPIMSMLQTMADRKENRPLILIYGNRSPDSELFHNEIESLKLRLNLETIYVYSEPEKGWSGETGIITDELIARHIKTQHSQYHFFSCGPSSMMKVVEKSLHTNGIPYKQIHYELFHLV